MDIHKEARLAVKEFFEVEQELLEIEHLFKRFELAHKRMQFLLKRLEVLAELTSSEVPDLTQVVVLARSYARPVVN